METLNWITVSIVISSIGLEAWLDAKDQLGNYDPRETKTNIAIALIGLVVNIGVKGTMLSFFIWLEAFAFLDIAPGFLVWVVLFLLIDLQYYLFHLLGHKSRFFWAMHVIHHSSHKFNLTTAIRTPFTNSLFRFSCLAPIVLLGFEAEMVILVDSIILSAAFFQHTALVGKLGWIEYVINTPSHHRVHHASNEKYIDKNFGGILIIWDRLFGTFQEEEEPPVYGLTKPLKGRGVINVLFHEWYDIAADVYHASGCKEWIGYLFSRPGWKPGHRRIHHRQLLSYRQRTLFISLFLSAISPLTFSQSTDDFLRSGLAEEARHNEGAALEFYEQAIEAGPRSGEAVWRASRMLSNRAGRSQDKSVKAGIAAQALELADRAIQLDPVSKDARLCRIIALGIASEAAENPSDKLANAKVIYEEAHIILSYDPAFAPAHYVLGKWHLELGKLNWVERLTCNVLFGGIPKGVSLDESIRCFEKAIRFQPDFILFYYGKASALYQVGRYTEATAILEKALQLSATGPDDKVRLQNCARLLRETKQLTTKI